MNANAVIVDEPTLTLENGRWTVSARLRVGATDHTVWYRTAIGPLAAGSDPFLIAALLPASRLGYPVSVTGSVSPRLNKNRSTIADIFHVWDRGYQNVQVSARLRTPLESPHPAIACFFTGGVDSFYTLLKHEDEITTIVFVHGFDIRLDNLPLRERVSHTMHEIAAALGKTLIEVETNVRDFSNRYVSWEYFHGAALASVALTLSPYFGQIYIAASRCYADLSAWGSHPMVDPLWSTENLTIVHDGCEATRLEKTKRIVECAVARRTLRVCWENPSGAYNCGRCTKCLFAKARLRAIDALTRVETFDADLDLDSLERLPLDAPPVETTDLYEHVVRLGTDPELARALWRYLNEWHYRGIRGQARHVIRAIGKRLGRYRAG